MRAFGLTGVLAVGSNSLVNHGSVAGSGNSFCVGLAAVAGVGLDAFGLTAGSGGDYTLVPSVTIGRNGFLSLDHSAANVTVRAFGLTRVFTVGSDSLVNDNIMNNSIAVNSGFNPRHSTTGVSGLTLRQSNFQLQEVVAGNIDIKLAGNIAINRTGNSQQLILFYIIGCSLAAVNTEHSTHIGTGFRITVDTNDRVEPVAQALNIQSYIGVGLSAAGQMQVQEGSTLVVTISNSGVTQLDILGSSIVKCTVHTNRTRIGGAGLGHGIGSHNLAGIGQLHGLCAIMIACIVGIALFISGKALRCSVAVIINASIAPCNSAGGVRLSTAGHLDYQLDVIIAGDVHIKLSDNICTNVVGIGELGEACGSVVIATPNLNGNGEFGVGCGGAVSTGAANNCVETVDIQAADIEGQITAGIANRIRVNTEALFIGNGIPAQIDAVLLVGNGAAIFAGEDIIIAVNNIVGTGSIIIDTGTIDIEICSSILIVGISSQIVVVPICQIAALIVQIGQIVQILCIFRLTSQAFQLGILAQTGKLDSGRCAVAGVEASIRPCNFTAIIGGLACFFIVISALQLENQLNVIIAGDIHIKLCDQIGADTFGISQLHKLGVLGVLSVGTAPHFKYAVNTALALVCQVPAGTANHSVETVDIQASGAVDHIAFCAANRVRHHADTLVILNAIQA